VRRAAAVIEWERERLRVAVVGLGRFGLALACTSSARGHDVLGIDRAEEAVQRARDVVTRVVQAELAASPPVHELGLERVDAGVVAIGTQVEANIVTTAVLVEAGVPHVVARADSGLHAAILERVGAHRVVSPETASGEVVAQSLRVPDLRGYLDLDADVGIGTLRAPAAWGGRSLEELGLDRAEPAFVALAIRRGGRTLAAPGPSEHVEAGDIPAVLTHHGRFDKLPQLRPWG